MANNMFECVAGRRITRNKEEMPASAMLEYMVKKNTNMEEELRISAQRLQLERERFELDREERLERLKLERAERQQQMEMQQNQFQMMMEMLQNKNN